MPRRRVVAPPLLGGLLGDAEAGTDVGPGVSRLPQAGDGSAHGVIGLAGDGREVGDGVDVTPGNAARVGAKDAVDEGGVLIAPLTEHHLAFQQVTASFRCPVASLAA
jgi:hypothetical protein